MLINVSIPVQFVYLKGCTFYLGWFNSFWAQNIMCLVQKYAMQSTLNVLDVSKGQCSTKYLYYYI